MLATSAQSQSSTMAISGGPPSPTDVMESRKDSLPSTGLLIGLNAAIVVLLILVVAILIRLSRRQRNDRGDQVPQSPSSSETRPINQDQTTSPAGHSGVNYSAFHPSSEPVEISSSNHLESVSPFENRYYPQIPQALVPGGRAETVWGRNDWAGPGREEHRWQV